MYVRDVWYAGEWRLLVGCHLSALVMILIKNWSLVYSVKYFRYFLWFAFLPRLKWVNRVVCVFFLNCGSWKCLGRARWQRRYWRKWRLKNHVIVLDFSQNNDVLGVVGLNTGCQHTKGAINIDRRTGQWTLRRGQCRTGDCYPAMDVDGSRTRTIFDCRWRNDIS